MAGRGTFTYDRSTILLHWLTAALVAVLWVIGQAADLQPRGPLRTSLWSVHVSLGFLLALVLVLRLARRFAGGPRPHHDSLIERVAALAHIAIYVLLVAVIALGLSNAFLRGQNMFDLFRLPQIPADREFRRVVSGWHEWCANLLMVVALLHASIALAHHYIWRDDVLRRMWPGLPARSR